jgi:hypothetical protein
MICSLNILFDHPVSEATSNSKITGAYSRAHIFRLFKEPRNSIPSLAGRYEKPI